MGFDLKAKGQFPAAEQSGIGSLSVQKMDQDIQQWETVK